MIEIKKYLGVILICVCFLGVTTFYFMGGNSTPSQRPKLDQWCFDYAGVLTAEIEEDVNDQGRAIQRSFDIDFVVVIVPDLKGRDIREVAVEMFSDWQIGQETQGKKGVLILISQKDQKSRIEIGYDLEGIYTDAYVGEVEREILVEFLEQAEWGIGFLATIENFLFRIYNQDLQQEVREISYPDDQLTYYSQGAGATNIFNFGDALNKPLPPNYDEIRQYFSAQATPELAFERYLELGAQGVKHDNDLTLFTKLSNEFWRDWRHTSGQQKAEAREVSGRPYFIKIKGNRAVVFFPAETEERMKKSPLYFLFESDEGWQMDIAVMTRCLRVVGPGWMMLTETFHPYSEIIVDEYNLKNGFLVPWDESMAVEHFYKAPSWDGGSDTDLVITLLPEVDPQFALNKKDRIISIDGQKIHSWDHLWSFFKGVPAGKTYSIVVEREGQRKTITETMRGDIGGFDMFKQCMKTPRVWMGVYMVQALDKEWRQTIKMRNQGKFDYSSLCEIIEVYPGSPADRAGLKPRDLIVHYGADDWNGEIMPYDVTRHMYSLKDGDSMHLTIVRDLKKVMKIKVRLEETMHRGYF